MVERHEQSNWQEKEDEVDEVYKTLKEKHGSKYDVPKLRLWARMVCTMILRIHQMYRPLQMLQRNQRKIP